MHTHIFRAHDFIGFHVLQHAVLVNAGLVAEGVLAHDGLVVLHRHAGVVGHHLGGAIQERGVDVVGEGHDVLADPQRHHDLFQRGIAGTFTDAVDGAFHLARAGQNARQAVGHRQAQVVVAVGGEDHLVGIGHAVPQHRDDVEEFLRRAVTHRIGNIDHRGAGLDGDVHAAAQEVRYCAGGVFRRPFHFGCVVARARHGSAHRFQHRILAHVELVLHVHGRSGNKRVNPGPKRTLQRFAGAVNVLETGAAQAADAGALDDLADLGDGTKIALRRNRESCLDHVHAHFVEQHRDLQLLVVRHGSAGRLLAIAQGGVENLDRGRFDIGGHDKCPSVRRFATSVPSFASSPNRTLAGPSRMKRD